MQTALGIVDHPPSGVDGLVVAYSRRSLEVVAESLVTASRPDNRPTVSFARQKIEWPSGPVAHLGLTTDPNGIRGLSVGWVFWAGGSLDKAFRYHLQMVLRQPPGVTVLTVADVLRLVG